MNIAFPFHVDAGGRTASVDDDSHIRQLIEQVLFTTPGERVNRPSFGSGLMQLVFSPNSAEVATATQFLVQGALQQWLGALIQVQGVDIEVLESRLSVNVRYLLRRTQQPAVATFSRAT